MPNNQTKALVQGSMMVAIFTILMTMAAYVPLISILALLFAPLPIAWYSANYNRKSSILVGIAGALLTFFTSGIIMLPFALVFGLLGLVMGEAIRLKKSKVYIFISSGIAMLFSFAIIHLCTLFVTNVNIIQMSLQFARENYEQSLEITKPLSNQMTITPEQLDMMFKTMELTVPATVTITAFLLAFLVIAVNMPLLGRLGLDVPKFAPFQDMRLPRAVLWYYMIVLSINLFIRPELGSTLQVIVLNVSYMLWLLLIVQGISLIHYFIASKGLPNPVKWVATLLAIPLSSFIILIGIIDLGFDVRSFIAGKTKK